MGGTRRQRWRAAEKAVAVLADGKIQPGSGNQWHAKGDVKSAVNLLQVKSTSAKSYVLKLDDLRTIEQQALEADRQPRLVVDFITPSGSERWVVQRYYGEE